MATSEQIKYAKQVGYEHGYLNTFKTHQIGRMTLKNTSQEQFKHNKQLSDAWQKGLTKYHQDLQNGVDNPFFIQELEVGKDGPFSSFYNNTGKGKGKKSKRRGGENKNKTQKKNRRQNKKRN